MSREEVYKAIDTERSYQNAKWGGDFHDEQHTLAEWLLFIEMQLNEAKLNIYNSNDARGNLRKIAALSVAAGEYIGMPRRLNTLSEGLSRDIVGPSVEAAGGPMYAIMNKQSKALSSGLNNV